VDCGKLVDAVKNLSGKKLIGSLYSSAFQSPRRYSAGQLSQRLAAERHVILGAEQIRRILKKKLLLETTAENTTDSEPQLMKASQADWELLKLWAPLGLVHLKYLDESGCCGHCPTGYGYAALLATKTHQAIATARAASQYLGSVGTTS
jgi:hypothetical protein